MQSMFGVAFTTIKHIKCSYNPQKNAKHYFLVSYDAIQAKN